MDEIGQVVIDDCRGRPAGGASRCRRRCVTAGSEFEPCLCRKAAARSRVPGPGGDFHAISISDVVPRRACRAGRGANRCDVGHRYRHRLSRRRHRHTSDPCRTAAGRQRAARPRFPARARPGVAARRRRCAGALVIGGIDARPPRTERPPFDRSSKTAWRRSATSGRPRRQDRGRDGAQKFAQRFADPPVGIGEKGEAHR